ncbi:ABC transporter, ATP-binding protein [Oesophagostomum dentatum]|uniref:ABC transporter, ATP-binding protein n=1 Tax=Oesophagostomum dentatum TaxID=61180 RepID=A0A0B1TG29_OESDE|nr:ABC transporter, ATP-binding protein [Oesophagostomum dentatum]
MLHSTLCIAAICLDMFLSFGFVIFYGPDAKLTNMDLKHYINLWSFYSIFSSATDLATLAFVRSLALLVLAKKFPKIGKYTWVFWLICIFSYIFTLAKILCLAEDIVFLSRPGVVLSLVWSVAATVILGYLIYCLPEVSPCKYSILLKPSKSRTAIKRTENEIPVTTKFFSGKKRKEELTTLDHIRVLLGYCKHEWKWFTAGFSALVVFVGAEIFEPSATGYVLSTVIDKKGYHALIIAVLLRIGVTFTAIIFGGFAEGCMEYSTSLIGRKLRLDLFTSLVLKDIAFFDVTNSGEMVSRLTADCQTVSTAISSNLTQFFRSVIVIIGALSFLLYYSWRMTLVTFITFPLMVILTKLYGSFYDVSFEHYAIKTLDLLFSLNVWLRSVLPLAKSEGHMKIFVLTLNDFHALQIFAYMKHDSEKSLFSGKEKPQITGRIELNSVNFMYPSRPNRKILENIDLKLESGQTIAFVGSSGGGKSTVVSLIERFYKPTKGEVLMDGVPVDKIDHEYYHEKVALVAQEPVLYNGTIRENILYGCEWATEADMLRAQRLQMCTTLSCSLRTATTPNVVSGELSCQVSSSESEVFSYMDDRVSLGGQKQRIAIARALVRRPAVLILDEATSALDSHSENAVQESLKKIAGKLTVIIIAHRLSTIEHADRIYVINGGKIVQSGTHSEMLKDVDGPYHRLVAKQNRNV